ncbi:MAG: hypothetical protein IMW97_03820 [Firmicutes bacterium]|nr:hypothetical protein [Candidatus Fermentithermobacillaceae bacterium]
MANCVICGASNLMMGRVPLVIVDSQWYCEKCLKKVKGKVVCSKCGGEAFVADGHFKTVDGQYMCTDCMEKAGIMKKYEYIMQASTSFRAQAGAASKQPPAAGAGDSAHGGMRAIIEKEIGPGEQVEIFILGNAGEAIACSKNRVIVAKTGIAAGSVTGQKVRSFKWSEIQDLELKIGNLYGILQVRGSGLPDFDPANINDAKRADNAVTFLVSRKKEFEDAVAAMKSIARA